MHYIFLCMIKWNDVITKSCFNAYLPEAEYVFSRLYWRLLNRME